MSEAGPKTGEAATGPAGELLATQMPRTLHEYYGSKEPAARFVKRLSASGTRQFDDADIDAVLSQLDQLDPLLKRTLALASEATRARTDAAANQFVGWAGKVAAKSISEMGADSLDPASAPAEIFRHFARILAERSRSDSKSEPKLAKDERRKRNQRDSNALRVAYIWLNATRGLDPVDALPGFSSLLRAQAPRRMGGRRRLSQLLATAPPKGLDNLLVLADELATSTEATRTAALETEGRARRLEEHTATISRLLTEAETRISELEATAAARDAELKDTQRSAEVANHAARDRLHGITARVVRLLRSRLSVLLRDALDALAGDPIYIEVAVERLNAAIEDVAREEKWLAALE